MGGAIRGPILVIVTHLNKLLEWDNRGDFYFNLPQRLSLKLPIV